MASTTTTSGKYDSMDIGQLRVLARPKMKHKGNPFWYADRQLCIEILEGRDEQAARDDWCKRRQARTRGKTGPHKHGGRVELIEDEGKADKSADGEAQKSTDTVIDAAGLGRRHRLFKDLFKATVACRQVWLVGPAGSGKTTAAKQLAKVLKLPFYFNGAIDSEYKLKGFIDVQGRVVCPAFRKAIEKGGVYLFDEVDSSLPPAVLAFNAALANDMVDFPDAQLNRHETCIIIAAANTYGLGGDADYVGRYKQDAAFIDRFPQLEWEYDEQMERELSGNEAWALYVQKCRAAAKRNGLKVVISPRATIFGAQLLAAGMAADKVIKMTVRKGIAADQWQMIAREAGTFVA